MPSPNDDRSRSKDPMQDDFRATNDNRSKQIGEQSQKQGQQEQGGQAQGAGSGPGQGTGAGQKK